MPWKETTLMEQRVKFVAEYQQGEVSFALLCGQFGISRTTGYNRGRVTGSSISMIRSGPMKRWGRGRRVRSLCLRTGSIRTGFSRSNTWRRTGC